MVNCGSKVRKAAARRSACAYPPGVKNTPMIVRRRLHDAYRLSRVSQFLLRLALLSGEAFLFYGVMSNEE